MRCFNPLRWLQAHQLPVAIYQPGVPHHFDVVLLQAWSVFATSSDGMDPDAVLQQVQQLRDQGISIVVDNCDNQFYNPQQDVAWDAQVVRLRALLGMADALVCATDAVLEITREQGFTQPGHVVGDAVESQAELQLGDSWLRRYLNPKRWPSLRKAAEHKAWVAQQRASGHIPLVWFGNHGVGYAEGGMLDLLKLQAQLEQMYPTRPVSLTVMSNHRGKYEQHIQPWRIPTRYVDWDRTTFLELLRVHEVAVVPVQLNDFTRCKSNNRVATALQNGLNVVADSIPAYEPLRPYCLLDDWQNLSAYLQTHDLRKSQLQSATAYLQAHCSQAAVAQQWRQVFERLD